jgi:hypothetical protein
MNNTFDINRFFKLVKRQWLSNSKEYLLIIGVLIAVLCYFYGNFIYDIYYNPDYQLIKDDIFRNFRNTRIPLFIILGILYVTYIASSSYNRYGKSSSVIPEILLPASQLEKFLTSWLYSFVLAFIVYIGLFLLIDLSVMSFIRSNFTSTNTYFIGDQKIVEDNLLYFKDIITREDIGLKYWYTIPIVFNAFFMLGAIYFSKLPFIKSIVAFAAYVVVFVLLFYTVDRMFFQGSISLDRGNTKLEDAILITSLLGFTLSIFLWIITFIRLKEKEA